MRRSIQQVLLSVSTLFISGQVLADHREALSVCDDAVPYFRAYRNDISDHLYTTSAAEIRAIARQGYRYEGIAFYALPDSVDGDTVQIARLYNPNNGGHYLTADENEWRTLVNLGWRLEQRGGYVFSYPEPFTVLVYRLYNHATGKHLFTADENEVRSLTAADWASPWEIQSPLGYALDCGRIQ